MAYSLLGSVADTCKGGYGGEMILAMLKTYLLQKDPLFLTVVIKVGARCNQGSESESFEALPLLL